MSLIVCVGDIHVSDKAPANCHDSYTDDIITVLKWIADCAANLEADAVVWAGDIFHHKAPTKNSHALVLKMIEVVRYYKNLDLDLQIVAGNHDMTNDRHETVHAKQPLGVLYAAGAKELHGWHDHLPLYGIPWQQDWTTNTPKALERGFSSWTEDKNAGAWSLRQPLLAVTHAPIYPPIEVERGVPFDLVSTAEIAEEMGQWDGGNYLYYGHIHEDHGIFSDGGVTFANMGAVSRGSLHEYNLERRVKIAVWTDIDCYGSNDSIGDYEFSEGFNEVVVPVAKPASEVFRLEAASLNKIQRLDLEQFLNRVGAASLDISSVASVIEHLKTLDDVPGIVITRAIEFLEAVDA